MKETNLLLRNIEPKWKNAIEDNGYELKPQLYIS